MLDFLRTEKDGDKKRELEENIEQIRQKVQQEDMEQPPRDNATPSEQPGSAAPQPPASPAEDSTTDMPADLPGSGQREAPSTGEDASAPSDRRPAQPDQQSDVPADSSPDPSTAHRSPRQQKQERDRNTSDQSPDLAQRSASSQPEQDRERGNELRQPVDMNKEEGRGEENDTRLSEDEVPEPPEVKDLDIPEIQKGPLFITVNKFKSALTTLSEMKSLADDLETSIGALENTLAEDHETEQQMRELLDETVEDTEVIQDIVNPETE